MNEIVIVVKGRNETAPVFAEVRADAATLGDDSGEAITEHITRKLKVLVSDPTIQQAGGPIGDVLGKNISDHVTETLKIRVKESIDRDGIGDVHEELDKAFAGSNSTEHVKIKADLDFDEKKLGARIHEALDGNGSILGDIGKFGEKAGDEVGDGMKSGLTGVFSGDIFSTIIKAALVGVTATVIAPLIGPAIGTALSLAFGGGAIGAGVASALKDPQIQTAIGGLKTSLGRAFDDFGDDFKGPVLDFLSQIPSVLKPLQPLVAQIGADLAPVAASLGQGVIGFLQNVLPSIGRLTDASGPIVKVLGDKLPGIGDAMAGLFDTISKNSGDTAQFFKGLLDAIKLIIEFVGVLIGAFYKMYDVIRTVMRGLVNVVTGALLDILVAANDAFGWVPGLGPKLRTASQKVADFREKVMKELSAIPDKTITITIKQRFVQTGKYISQSQIDNPTQLYSGLRSGGVKGAASGRTSGGLTWTGEDGPELLNLPPGTGVHTAGDSARMAAQMGGGSAEVVVGFDKSGLTGLALALMETLRAEIAHSGGNVQRVLGVPGAM